jgi:predicted amidohydrolase YtcJ
MLLRDVVLDGRRVDVRLEDGRVREVGRQLDARDDLVLEGRGGAVLPGLHDHHLHLLASAAADASVPCGPPHVTTRAALAGVLRAAPGSGWVRGVGYDTAVAGDLGRDDLDLLLADRPVRLQHRGGALWVLNTAALDALGPGGPPDGRLWRRDVWLRDRLGAVDPPDLTGVGRRLAARGITGVTDATPGSVLGLDRAVTNLPQHAISLGDASGTSLPIGPLKVVLSDHDLPPLADLVQTVRASHAAGRPVAVHTVTRHSLLLLLAALQATGTTPGDRLEHAAVVPEEALDVIADLGLVVVTQPSLVAQRGDDYLDRVDADDVPHLWRHASLMRHGIAVALSSDAPYGELDPWSTIAAATQRRTKSGQVLGAPERVDAVAALAGFLTEPFDPGGAVRTIRPGAPADLVVLDGDLDSALADPIATRIRATLIEGRMVHEEPTW